MKNNPFLPVILCLFCVFLSGRLVAGAPELPVDLGAAGGFAVLAGSTVTSTGFTVVQGDLGVWSGTAVTGFPPGIVIGSIHAGDPAAMAAQGALTVAYNDAALRTIPDETFSAGRTH
jgi:hypothetical protein